MGREYIDSEPNQGFIKGHCYIKAVNKQEHFEEGNHELTNNGVNGCYKKNSRWHFEEDKIEIKSRYSRNHNKKPCFRTSKYRVVDKLTNPRAHDRRHEANHSIPKTSDWREQFEPLE